MELHYTDIHRHVCVCVCVGLTKSLEAFQCCWYRVVYRVEAVCKSRGSPITIAHLSGITVCNVIPSCCDDHLLVEILRSGHVINICQRFRCFADVPNMQIMFHNQHSQ